MATTEELRLIDTAKLDILISKLMEAATKGDQNAIEQLKAAVNTFKIDTFFVDLQKRAREVVDEVSYNQIAAACVELASIATRLSGYDDAIKLATTIAEEGKSQLFLPNLAAQTGRIHEILSAFKAAGEKVITNLSNIHGIDDVATNLTDALDAVAKLRKAIDGTTA